MVIMKKQVEVVTAIIKYNNKYFAAQRNNFGELAKKWEFPGGKIEKGESNEEALIREIKEELKTDIVIKNFFMTVNHEYKTFNLTLHAYLCEANTEEIYLTEHLNSKWLKKEDLKSVDWAEADIPIVEKIIKNDI